MSQPSAVICVVFVTVSTGTHKGLEYLLIQVLEYIVDVSFSWLSFVLLGLGLLLLLLIVQGFSEAQSAADE